jgi:capsular polysaccharide biosynthesis protein
MNQNSEQTFNFNSILFFLLKWRKALIVLTLLSGIFAFIFSLPFFIKPKFQSTVVMYPTTTNSVSKALFDEGVKQDILEFGEEAQAEQLLQVLGSEEIKETVIKKFDLMKHYDIDPNSKYPQTKLSKEFDNNITFERTEFMSVKINVLDENPQLAADIANTISDLLDSTKTKIQHERAKDALKIVENEYNSKTAYIKSIVDSLTVLGRKGIFDYETQSETLNKAYADALSAYHNESAKLGVLSTALSEKDSTVVNSKARMRGAEARIKIFEKKLGTLAEYGSAEIALTGLLKAELLHMAFLKESYDKAKIDANQNISHKFIINKAVKAEKKYSPLRSLIILGAMACTFLMTILVIVIIENIQKFNLENLARNNTNAL